MTLRLVAQYADMWNGSGGPREIARLNGVLNDWCAKVGRDPATIERTLNFDDPSQTSLAEDYLRNSITHLIFETHARGLDFASVEKLIAWRDSVRDNS